MFWADRIAEDIRATRTPKNGVSFVIRDEKTLSGRVHIGSMRGVAIHGVIAEVLTELGVQNEYKYELNDFDPFDAIPGYLNATAFTEYLGKPLYTVPSPEPGFESYADYFGKEFVSVHQHGGFTPMYYKATELYRSGKMDALIHTALSRASDIRRILQAVSGSEKDATWLPVSVVCEHCGKMMTTRATDYDGTTVGYVCDRTPDGTTNCGHVGRVAPTGGAAKLFWKVDWAAKWVALGVDIEGAGKDHSTKGGSRDVANHIAREIFDCEPPYDIPYEFFLVGGKKMSSSKGRGASAKEFSELFPPHEFRLSLIGKDIREQIDIDPSGESVPRHYDWYDDLASGVRDGGADDYARLFSLCQLPDERGTTGVPWELRFRDLAFVIQMPHLSLHEEALRAKGGALTTLDTRVLDERAAYADFWLAQYAPEEFKYVLQQEAPKVTLSDTQKKAVGLLADFLRQERTGEAIHARLHELKTEVPIAPKELFQALYRIFLARDSGPKAGWFLAGLSNEFVVERLRTYT